MKHFTFSIVATLLMMFSCKPTASNGQAETHKNITVEQYADFVKNNPDAIIIDVRTPEEVADGMIPKAIQADVKSKDFEKMVSKLNKDETYLVYCRSGKRSLKACGKMSEMGFKNLTNMEGGYNAWSDQN